MLEHQGESASAAPAPEAGAAASCGNDPSQLSTSRQADEAAVRRLTAAMAAAWNGHDAAAYAGLFTEDADYIAFDGTHLRGRQANTEHHRHLFETVLRGSRLVFERVAVRFLTPDVALMHGDGSVLLPWHDALPPRRRSIQTYVVVREAGAWRIAAFHNARVRPLTLPSGLALRLVVAAMRARAAMSRMSRRARDACHKM
jgi:uncharacterized protein (TIGR02246 family)